MIVSTLGGQSFTMILARKVKQLWPDRFEDVMTQLNSYTGAEPERVKLAAVKLSKGSYETLVSAVASARTDFRDVLAWAEYPRQMKSGAMSSSPSEEGQRRREEITRKDRQEYEEWLRTDADCEGAG